MSIKIALAGNPNCGKTTLFNNLTGSNQYVGNWPGVTVEKKEGKLKGDKDVIIQDLPGIYSLSPYTLEEVVSRTYLVKEKPDAILNIIDGTNIERNLYLTTQLIELGIPVVMAVNMMDIVRKSGDQININQLSQQLGCKVVEISALKGDGVMAAAEAAIEALQTMTAATSKVLRDGAVAELESSRGDEKEIRERFYGPLEFGTAGLRGTMKVGLHQMNVHVIRWATQGFANVICAEGEEGKHRGVAICMDCRNHSMEFARAAACVMAGNGITVKLFESLRPTPELSFAVREYGCEAGINVTASHNPKEYNGYKVYWSDGAQLPPQHAAAIADELTRIDIFTGVRSMDYEQALAEGRIELLGEDCDRRFMANVMGMVNDYETVKKVADDFGLVYTPFHGCGYKLVPEALTALGIKHLIPVPEQMVIDGNFPTVVSPNPENPEGFYLAIDLA